MNARMQKSINIEREDPHLNYGFLLHTHSIELFTIVLKKVIVLLLNRPCIYVRFAFGF
jgi:hypothetical protein